MGICMARQAGAETFEGGDRYTSGPLAHAASPIEVSHLGLGHDPGVRRGSQGPAIAWVSRARVVNTCWQRGRLASQPWHAPAGELSLDEFRQLFNAFNDKPGPEIDAVRITTRTMELACAQSVNSHAEKKPDAGAPSAIGWNSTRVLTTAFVARPAGGRGMRRRNRPREPG